MCPSSVSVSWPVAASHTFTVLSQLAEASRWPSGLNATLLTLLVCPLRVSISWPVAGVPHLHRLIVTTGGGDPRAVGAERHARDTDRWPLSVSVSCPVAASHTFTVSSWLAEAIRLPSGLNTTLVDIPGMPLERERLPAGRGVPHLHGLVLAGGGDPSPSGLNATPLTPPAHSDKHY